MSEARGRQAAAHAQRHPLAEANCGHHLRGELELQIAQLGRELLIVSERVRNILLELPLQSGLAVGTLRRVLPDRAEEVAPPEALAALMLSLLELHLLLPLFAFLDDILLGLARFSERLLNVAPRLTWELGLRLMPRAQVEGEEGVEHLRLARVHLEHAAKDQDLLAPVWARAHVVEHRVARDAQQWKVRQGRT